MPCPPAPPRSVPDAPPSYSPALAPPRTTDPLADHVQSRQHFLHRRHRGIELFGIARADHEIGVRLFVFVLERVTADDRLGMGVGDLPQRAADVAFPRI